MTIAVDLGREAKKQTNNKVDKSIFLLKDDICLELIFISSKRQIGPC